MWGEKDSNLRRFLNRVTVGPIWPLWYLPNEPPAGIEPATY